MSNKRTYEELEQRVKELEQAETKFINNEKFLNNIIEQSPYATWIADAQGTLQRANPALKKFLNLTDEQLVGKYNVLNDKIAERQGLQPLFQTVFKEGKTITFSLEWDGNDMPNMDLKGSNSVCVEGTMFPIHNSEGKLTNVVLNWIDITKRKQTEKSLKKSEETFKAIVGHVPVMIDSFDEDGKCIIWNKEAEKQLGYTIFEVNDANNALELFYGKEDAFKVYQRIMKKDGKFRSYYPIAKNGEKKYQEWADFALPDGRSVSIGIDLTEQKKLEKQLQQTQKMETIGTLAGGIAHDFNNILYPIVGYTEMLLEEIPEDSSLRESLEEIFTSTMRAKDLVKQILTFSRQDSSEIKPIKIQPIIKEALKLIRSTIPTSIEINQDISDGCGIIKADPTQIHQIVMNLATNAYHAMEDTGGELTVSLKEVELDKFDVLNPDMVPGTYTCLTVADTGIGMDKSVTEKIFDPFFTTKGTGKGTGMGLSVVHGIVNNVGGSIHVYSEVDKGTEFHVYLPVVKSKSEHQKPQIIESIHGGTERILLG